MTKDDIAQGLRICGKKMGCGHCPGKGLQDPLGERLCTELLMLRAAALIEQQDARIAGLEAKVSRWIPVTERMPKPETEVLALCNRNGYIFVTPVIYENGEMLTQDSAWNWNEIYENGLYNEETDDYFIPEGWWENRQFNPDDVYNNPVDCAVTHWMPLPGWQEVQNG